MADILGVRVNSDLDVIDTIIICNNAAGQTEPCVTFNGENYMVVWADAFIDGRDCVLKIARVTPDGVVLDSGNPIGSGDSQTAIASDGNNCLIVWSKSHDGVYGRLIDRSANPVSATFRIALLQGTSTIPQVAYGDTNYLVVWADFCSTGTDQDIYAQLVTAQGNLVGEKLTIAASTSNQTNPTLCYDGTKYFTIWSEDLTTVHGRFVHPDGTFPGLPFPISDSASPACDYLTVTPGLDNYLVAWNVWYDDFEIYGDVSTAIGIGSNSAYVPGLSRSPAILHNLHRFHKNGWEIFDLTGRRVDPRLARSGLYFVKKRDQSLQKIIIIK